MSSNKKEKVLQDKLKNRELSSADIIYELAMRTGNIGMHMLSINLRHGQKEEELEK